MEAINNILYDKYDLGIIRYQTAYENYYLDYLAEKEFKHDIIWEFEYVVVFSKNNQLASSDKLKAKDLEGYIEILYADQSIPNINLLEPKKAETKTVLKKEIYVNERCSQLDLLTHVPNTYMWASPISEELLNRFELVQRKCTVPIHQYKDVLIYPKTYKFTSMDKKLIDKLYEARNEVAFRNYH